MAVFSYTALKDDAAMVSGVIVADTPRQARDSLRAQGLTIQQVKERRDRAASSFRPGARHGREVLSFVRELSTLLGAGVTLLDAVDTIAQQYKRHRAGFGLSLLQLRDRLSAGLSLSASMAEQPRVFDLLCVSLVEVGESAGTLETTLLRLAEFKERSAALKNRVASVLIYPAIVGVMAIAISLLLMTVVVPSLLTTLVESGRAIPWPTRIVKAASDLVIQDWWLLAIIVGVIVLATGAILRTTRGRRFWHGLQLRLPLIGEPLRKQAMVRLCVVMSTLLRSGVTFVRALQVAQRTTPNVVIRQALENCETTIHAGGDISEALEKTGVFPAVVVRIFSVGQQSGRLEEMLDRLAFDYDQQVAQASQRLTAILEPVLILSLALLVGFIAFATLMPLLEAADVS